MPQIKKQWSAEAAQRLLAHVKFYLEREAELLVIIREEKGTAISHTPITNDFAQKALEDLSKIIIEKMHCLCDTCQVTIRAAKETLNILSSAKEERK